MPGSHPCGSWIRQRAKRIQEETKKEYGKEKGERVAYAVATQQAHAKGKSPKRYGTPEGRAEAKDKHEEPEKMQEKAAMWAGYFNESEKLAVSMGAASPLLRILGRSFIRPVKTVRHAFRKKKGLDVDRCSSGPATAGGSVQVGLFCGEAVDAEIATRVRPYAEDDACVVRPLWVLEDRLLDDVALLSREEALGTADALTAIAVLMREDGEGCAHVDEPVWYVPLDRLLPLEFQPDPTGGSAFLGYPPMGQDLLDFWRVRVKKGSTVLPYSVYDMKNLVPERCLHLQSQVRDARKSIEIRVDLVPDAFQWFPVSWLP